MEVIVNPTYLPLPLGVAALDLLLNKKSTCTFVAGACMTLRVGRITLKDEASIMRYMVRGDKPMSTNELYKESSLSSAAIDEWLLKTRAVHLEVTPKDFLSLAKEIDTTITEKFLTGASISLADLSAWSFFKSYELVKSGGPSVKDFTKFQQWYNLVNEMPECKQAVEVISKALESAKIDANKAAPQTVAAKFEFKPTDQPLDIFRASIAHQLSPLVNIPAAEIMTMFDLPKGQAAETADFCIPAPKLRVKGKADELATKFAAQLKTNEFVEEITTTGPFINFLLRKSRVAEEVVPAVVERIQQYGQNQSHAGQNVIVEFSSPNIAKPFHAGHLRGTIIGNFVRNVCQANGMKTHAINYLGDWGKQYGLLAVGYDRYGSEPELLEDPIKHLFHVYVKINKDAEANPGIHDEARAYFKRMEDGDKDALALWSRFRNLSIEKYIQIYERLNIRFDEYSGESQFSEAMERMLKHLTDKQLLVEDKGAMIVDLKPFKLTPAVIQKTDGATLYITRDLAAAWERYKAYKFDRMYYVVGAPQDLHFQQVFKILDLAGFDWANKCSHINFGYIRGMSTRKGNAEFLEDILDAARETMHEVMKSHVDRYTEIEDPMKIADTLGISAVIIQDMSARRIKDYDFKWERMTSFEGDTGPYLQYAHTRMCSIERKYLENRGISAIDYNKPPFPLRPEILKHLDHVKVKDMLFMVGQYPELVRSLPQRNFEPCNVVSYLFQLCRKVSSCLEDVYVMGQDKDIAEARFWAYWSSRIVIGNALRLLGLRPVERM